MSTTEEMSTNEDIIGRADVNDLEAILAVTNTDVDEAIHAVKDNADAIFTWDYEKGARPALNKLYEKAKTSQWNGETDLRLVDRGRPGGGRRRPTPLANGAGSTRSVDLTGTAASSTWDDKEWLQLGIESQNWTLSQFMHGEQGALICTAKIVETVPWIDAKYYAVDPGDGRGPPRRGVRQVPRHQAVGPLPDQRPPQDAARRHHRTTAAGT